MNSQFGSSVSVAETATAITTKDLPKPPVVLTPLTSIRFFAALHIFIYHLDAFRQLDSEEIGLDLSVFDNLVPEWANNWIKHGYCSTSLFFLISGFILAYLYTGPDGEMRVNKRKFWIARLARVYPLHLVLLPFVAVGVHSIVSLGYMPGDLSMGGADWFEISSSALLNATLLQAWFPPYALNWNFPTWALSAVAFFYFAFPFCVFVLHQLTRVQLFALMMALPVASLVPTILLFMFHPAPNALVTFSRELVTRSPLLWLPHFALGIVLSRLFHITRYNQDWRRPARFLSWGDAAIVLVFLMELLHQSAYLPWLNFPDLFLRHGILAPLYLIIIYDLAQNHGLLARFLNQPGMRLLGECSFSIFMLQWPVMILGMIIFTGSSIPSVIQLAAVVLLTVCLSIASTKFFEKPLANCLRKRFESALG